jgi:hypothetical protein
MRADGGEIATGVGAASMDPLELDIDAHSAPRDQSNTPKCEILAVKIH